MSSKACGVLENLSNANAGSLDRKHKHLAVARLSVLACIAAPQTS